PRRHHSGAGFASRGGAGRARAGRAARDAARLVGPGEVRTRARHGRGSPPGRAGSGGNGVAPPRRARAGAARPGPEVPGGTGLGTAGGLMRWDAPWALALLLLLPLALWRRGRAGPPPAVLWVRSHDWGGRFGPALMKAVTILPWVAAALAVTAMARPQQGLRLSETETRGVDV